MEEDGKQKNIKVDDPTKSLGKEADKLKVDLDLLKGTKKNQDDEKEPAEPKKDQKLARYMK
jgi:hypothetical protein